jgi:hypothetical protein
MTSHLDIQLLGFGSHLLHSAHIVFEERPWQHHRAKFVGLMEPDYHFIMGLRSVPRTTSRSRRGLQFPLPPIDVLVDEVQLGVTGRTLLPIFGVREPVLHAGELPGSGLANS